MTSLTYGISNSPLPRNESPVKSVTVNGMTFQWRFDREQLNCIATAPTTGWVAVGFNTNDKLKGTNLIMGAIEQDFINIDDRFIVEPGNHKSITELGGSEALTQKGGEEKDGISTIWFSIPLSVNDRFHHDLTEGKEYHLLLAYSQEDDFQHHSIMRTSVKVKF